MKRIFMSGIFILALGTEAALAQATPPLTPAPTVGRSLNDGGTSGMTPMTPRANQNTATGGPVTTGSGNDNMLYNQSRTTTKRMRRH
jgi:hypothetical protein